MADYVEPCEFCGELIQHDGTVAAIYDPADFTKRFCTPNHRMQYILNNQQDGK